MIQTTSTRRRARQNGSALLIVFVFAAMIAIMLYKEMPIAAFEAQRQKEQLLMDRGNEYKRAVKLYVRKFQSFPPSMEALENTNRMRFLRNRYVDPFSGKDDWRLLHAGPGGIIIDSKIKKNLPGPNGASGTTGVPVTPTTSAASSSSFGTPFSTSSFGNSVGFASSTNTSAQPATQSASGSNGQPPATGMLFPARPPAVLANGGSDSGTAQDAQSADGQMPAQAGYPGASSPDSGQSGSPFPPPGSARFRNAPGVGDGFVPAQTDGTAQDPQAMLQAMLQNQSNPQQAVQQPTSGFNNNNNGAAGTANATPSAFGTNSQNTQNPTQMGQMGSQMGGGIAGVASKTTGHSIKVFNDQTDRSLWEFVYDMQQEAMANAPGMGPTNSTTSNGGINATQGNQSNSTGANSIAPSSSFGSGFGISPTQPPTTPPAPPPNQ